MGHLMGNDPVIMKIFVSILRGAAWSDVDK